MSGQLDMLSLVAALGWLVLAAAGFASYRLNWKKSVTMALVWIAIFAGVGLLFALSQGSAAAGT